MEYFFVFENHEKNSVDLIMSLLDKMSKIKTLKKWYKKFLSSATKIDDLAGELKNSTIFSVAPPNLILCAKPDQYTTTAAEHNGQLRLQVPGHMLLCRT